MYSVTSRIKSIKQPQGGYVKPREFEVIVLKKQCELNEKENISPILVGLAVDYLTRFMMSVPLEQAFSISLLGAKIIEEENSAKVLLAKIKGLDDISIKCACKLVGYDVCFRNGISGYKPIEEINADKETIQNIVIMVQRSLTFWNMYGPLQKVGFTLEGGYTCTVSSGDGDFLTKDILWDFKVSKQERIKSKDTLQLLMYYLMGCFSIHEEFKNVKKLGVYNPRKNKIYLMSIEKISKEIFQKVMHDVIGYGLTEEELADEVGKFGWSIERIKNIMSDDTYRNTLAPEYKIETILKYENIVKQWKQLYLQEKDIVYHKEYGIGEILKIEMISGYDFVTVMFENIGEKMVLLESLKLN